MLLETSILQLHNANASGKNFLSIGIGEMKLESLRFFLYRKVSDLREARMLRIVNSRRAYVKKGAKQSRE